jgi:hypothetical protein
MRYLLLGYPRSFGCRTNCAPLGQCSQLRLLTALKARVYHSIPRFSYAMNATFCRTITVFNPSLVLSSSDIYAGPSSHSNSSSPRKLTTGPSWIISLSFSAISPRCFAWQTAPMTYYLPSNTIKMEYEECEREEMTSGKMIWDG